MIEVKIVVGIIEIDHTVFQILDIEFSDPSLDDPLPEELEVVLRNRNGSSQEIKSRSEYV